MTGSLRQNYKTSIFLKVSSSSTFLLTETSEMGLWRDSGRFKYISLRFISGVNMRG